MNSTRFGLRRNRIGELVLLPANSSPKASRRLRHALYYLTFGQGEPTGGLRYREPVMAAPETRRERRARTAAFKRDMERLAAQAAKVTLEPAELIMPVSPTPLAPEPTLVRKITGAVRRGLARGKKA